MTRRDKVLIGLVFGLTSVAFVWPALRVGGTFAATDLTLAASPYREDFATQPWVGNSLQSDQLSQLPLVLEFYSSLRQGEIQLWEPDQGAGMPLGTAVYNQLLLPWNLVLLFVTGPLGPTLASLLAVYMAQIGMFLFARRLGLGPWGAALAAVAYTFSGPVTALHLRIEQVLLVPWAFWACHGAITERRARDVVVLALAVALILLGGFPAGALFSMYALAAFAVYMVVRKASRTSKGTRLSMSWATAWPVVAAAIAGGLIATVQLLPSYAFLQEAGSLERAFPIWHRAGLVKLATAVSGQFFGSFQGRDWWWPELGYSNPVEASSTMGAVVLLLLGVVVLGRGTSADRRNMPIWEFLMPMALIVVVGVYLGGVVLGVLHQLPFLAENSFGRSRFLVSFVVAIVAGYGFSAVVEGRRDPAPAALRLETSLLLVFVAIGSYEGLTVAAQESRLSFVVSRLLVPIAACALGALVMFLFRWEGWVKGLVVVSLLAVELLWGAWGFTPGSPPEAFYPEHRSFETISDDVGPGGQYRLTALGLFDVLPPNEAALLDLSDARYFYPVVGEYEDLWPLVDPGLTKRGGEAWITHLYTEQYDPTSVALDRMAVKYLAVPLDKPLQDVASHTIDISNDPKAAIELPTDQESIRGIELAVTLESGCRDGWLVLSNGSVSSRRLVREIGETVVFPLPDVRGGQSLTVQGTQCAILDRAREATLYVAASKALSVVSVDDWVLYERPRSRPRAEMVSTVAALDDSDIRVLDDPDQRFVTFVSGQVPTVSPGGTARLVEDAPDMVRVEVESPGDGFLVLRDAFSEGWHAELDGLSVGIQRVDHAFRGVSVPAGRHVVVFEYRPTELTTGLATMAIGVVIVGLLAVFVSRGQQRLRPGQGTE